MKIIKVQKKENSINIDEKISKKEFSDNLRKNPTKSEKIVYDELKKRGYNFKFQHILYGYIPDFYFPEQNKIIELDGKCHNEEKDKVRDSHLSKRGVKILRISSSRVFYDLKWVINRIENFILHKKMKRNYNKTKGERKLRRARIFKQNSLYESEIYNEFLSKVQDL